MTARRPAFDALRQPLKGFHAIEASAGTGKTHSITLLWLRLLVEQQLRIDQVLVTTFTRAATAELQERLLASLRRALAVARRRGKGESSGPDLDTPEAAIVAQVEPHLEDRDLVRELETALSSFDLAPIHTIHGFCQSLISRHTLELGCDPGMEQVDDADEILNQIVADRLMQEADRERYSLSDVMQVAKAIAANPLAQIPAPLAAEEVSRRSHELLDPVLEKIARIPMPERSRLVILREVEAKRDTGKSLKFSDAQQKYLAPIMDEIRPARAKVRALYRSLAAASLYPMAALVREQFPLRKAAANLRTFDDILLTVHKALASGGTEGPLVRTIRERFRGVIVDECQDSDAIQIEVFQRLFTRAGSFLVIGDPKQSIYRFRGADLSSYQRLAAGANRAPEMTTNYRSDPGLVDVLNRLYALRPVFRGGAASRPIRYVEVRAQAPAARITDARVGEPALLLWSDHKDRARAKRDLARQTAREFRRLLDEPVTVADRETGQARPLSASDLAVLAASHADLALVRRELQELQIPCEQAGASLGSVWTSDEALDVHAWIEAVHALEEGSDPLAAMLAFAATPLFGLDATELDRLRTDPPSQAALAEQLIEDRNGLRLLGPLPLLSRYWADGQRIGSRLGTSGGERRLTNWRHLGCLLQAEWANGRARAGELELWLGRMRGQCGQRGDGGDGGDGSLMKLETDLPAVQLATVHAAKGLEYPIVCCPFLWHVKSQKMRKNAPFAVVRSPKGTVIDIGSERFGEHLDQAMAQEDEEQERLLYVALTRARHRLYLGLAPIDAGSGHENGAEKSALALLLGLGGADKAQWPALSPIPQLDPAARTTVHFAASADASTSTASTSSRSTTATFTRSTALTTLATAPKVDTHRGGLTRVSSYSALIRGEDAAAAAAAKDHDPEDLTEARGELARGEPGLLGDLNLTGNRLGQRIHALLEEILGNGRPLDKVVENLEPAFRTALETILETPIPLGAKNGTSSAPESVTLSMIRLRAMAEMHALLPVRSITPASLSEALLCDPLIAEDARRRSWAEELSRWDFGALQGFFQGYIDLVFEKGGRYYIVDYKTNALGSYEAASLEAAMLHHHYLLQSRFYTVALHRHLAATLPGYDPAEHLGGCAYLFLRGFPSQGIWFERAGVNALRALDALFAEASP